MFADGDLSLDLKSLSAFLDFIDADIALGKNITAIQLAAPFALKSGKATLSNMNITVDGNSGEGILEVVTDRTKSPLLSGTLDFQSLDLSSFVGAFLPLPDRAFQSTDQIDTSFISKIRTDLRLSANAAKFGDFVLGDVAATAQISENAAIP
ncbi:MAG: hypothetical protein U5K75_05890 [Ahrensia sp.]|nr:hypothetical protein [Ahrensia sp.]